jgi:hypothetical protein
MVIMPYLPHNVYYISASEYYNNIACIAGFDEKVKNREYPPAIVLYGGQVQYPMMNYEYRSEKNFVIGHPFSVELRRMNSVFDIGYSSFLCVTLCYNM